MGEFSKYMKTFDYVSGLHNFLEFSQPSSCLDEAIMKHGKSALLRKWRQQLGCYKIFSAHVML